MNWVSRDGRDWQIGAAADVAWIDAGTSVGTTITSGIPPVFDDYATVVLPENPSEQERHDHALISLLRRSGSSQRWWLGYLETGGSDIVFPEAPRVRLYPGWPYVLVLAGPEHAASWRLLPDLMFPTDRSWLVSTLWDDTWSCVGGPVSLVDSLLSHPDLGPRVRRVGVDENTTPPGHQAI
ncbi:hypothetical protein [Mycobacterium cookii]|uniref:Uncharacterized protein n=1 Tax=Mycobacterium cookii TaxID=1775 RepID=A0A7I7KZY1_9MYCO|nr:hypothetical protein [Mycobacterium cookii]MCV7330530.1 hypothetical protein [Mycobacterium cookii]BBX47279.1 hypothetical protein MCOO_32940 [Mycobacterium cookii]